MRLFRIATIASAAVVVAVLLTTGQASAAACKLTGSVTHSAVLGNNSADGGHVKAHVLGETPPAGQSQNNRTLFADGAKYAAAWRQYGYYGTVNCGGGHAISQTLTLAQLHMTSLDAYSCTAADGAGRCTAKTLYIAQSVTFAFVQAGGHWILNTCYPVPLI
jgi:hypothetical protein